MMVGRDSCTETLLQVAARNIGQLTDIRGHGAGSGPAPETQWAVAATLGLAGSGGITLARARAAVRSGTLVRQVPLSR
jgi:hypothetical protein